VLETKYLPGLPQIEADTGMLEQIVMNLAVNVAMRCLMVENY